MKYEKYVISFYLIHWIFLPSQRPGYNPLTAEWALRALKDFTLSNARRFYSSMGNPLYGKGYPPPSKANKLTVSMFFEEFSQFIEDLMEDYNHPLVIAGDFSFHVDDLNHLKAL